MTARGWPWVSSSVARAPESPGNDLVNLLVATGAPVLLSLAAGIGLVQNSLVGAGVAAPQCGRSVAVAPVRVHDEGVAVEDLAALRTMGGN